MSFCRRPIEICCFFGLCQKETGNNFEISSIFYFILRRKLYFNICHLTNEIFFVVCTDFWLRQRPIDQMDSRRLGHRRPCNKGVVHLGIRPREEIGRRDRDRRFLQKRDPSHTVASYSSPEHLIESIRLTHFYIVWVKLVLNDVLLNRWGWEWSNGGNQRKVLVVEAGNIGRRPRTERKCCHNRRKGNRLSLSSSPPNFRWLELERQSIRRRRFYSASMVSLS